MSNKQIKICLVGQPNVGKSVIFGTMTGNYATVSNYPGTTVEVTRGETKIGSSIVEVIDTPGLYSIFPITEEERVTLNIIKDESPDLIVQVIDAKNLERMLSLTFQLEITKIPMVLALNMFDEALSNGITIDTALLSSKLNMSVIATVAINKQGIGQLISAIQQLLNTPKEHSSFEWPKFSENLLKGWQLQTRKIANQTIKKRGPKQGLSKLDKLTVSPWSGTIILFLVLYLGLYKFVGSFGAGTVVDFLEGIFEKYLNPWLLKATATIIPWHWLQDLFIGEYGILTLGLRYAVAIILPIVGLFFLVFALIEDSGYLPRLSFLLDRLFKRIGLSGRAVIPMVLGLGCDTMATIVTRTLPTRRERLISTLLLSLCIPCSAQIGVILGLLSGSPYVLISWFLIIVTIFILTGTLLAKMIPGKAPSFIIEIPPLRLPQLKNVVVKTFARMKWYFLEIVPMFVVASFLIWVGQISGIFNYAVNAISYPLAMMGLPKASAPAFIFGFFRRDYGAAGLYDLHKAGGFTDKQLLVAVVVLTLFLPCITQFLVTIKERGWKTGIGISLFVLTVSFGVGVLLHNVMRLIGI